MHSGRREVRTVVRVTGMEEDGCSVAEKVLQMGVTNGEGEDDGREAADGVAAGRDSGRRHNDWFCGDSRWRWLSQRLRLVVMRTVVLSFPLYFVLCLGSSSTNSWNFCFSLA